MPFHAPVHLRDRHFFFHRHQIPGIAKGVNEVAFAVAIELICQRQFTFMPAATARAAKESTSGMWNSEMTGECPQVSALKRPPSGHSLEIRIWILRPYFRVGDVSADFEAEGLDRAQGFFVEGNGLGSVSHRDVRHADDAVLREYDRFSDRRRADMGRLPSSSWLFKRSLKSSLGSARRSAAMRTSGSTPASTRPTLPSVRDSIASTALLSCSTFLDRCALNRHSRVSESA